MRVAVWLVDGVYHLTELDADGSGEGEKVGEIDLNLIQTFEVGEDA